MKPFIIFLSWSQPRSYEIAKTLNVLLDGVFEDKVKCWLSKKDISAGGDWYSAIKNALYEADFGVICFTLENIDSPWLQFEGGALVSSILAKGQHEVPVCPYLFEVSSTHIPEPLGRRQAVTADYGGTKKLLESINNRLEAAQKIPPKTFNKLFDDYWKECGREFPIAHTSDMIGQLQEIMHSSRKIPSDLRVAANPCAEFLFVKACKKFFDNFTVTNRIANFTAPACTYPHYLLLLLKNFGYPVKAIALVDVVEDFWQGPIGKEIYKNTLGTSKRVFVFSSRDHLEKNFSFFLRHAQKYSTYAISRANLNRDFVEYAYDFSIIGTSGSEILARYIDTGKIKSIQFTTDSDSIRDHEKVLDEIISKSIEMTAIQAERITEAETETEAENFIESVFAKTKRTHFPHKFVEMSAYVSVPDYAQYEEQHAYFIEMMSMMLSQFNKLRDAEASCRVLELGSGTGHFTKRLLKSQNVLVTAVEIDWMCYNYLRHILAGKFDPLKCKYKVVNEDSCKFADPDGETFDFIFSSFADHHIRPEDKKLYFNNIKKNLSPKGAFIVGDEFIPSYDHSSEASFKSAVTRYHNHIIDIAKANGHGKLVELETAAMKSGLERHGDFKMPREEYEQCLKDAGLSFSKEMIGPKDLDDVGGIYVYVIRKK